MYRCDRRTLLTLALAAPPLLGSQTASAQHVVSRHFPANALRGTLVLESTSAALLNGKSIGLAPGLRIRGPDNLLMLSASLVGRKFTGHYSVDFLGQIQDLWILRDDEIARYWPRSAEEAAARVFDPAAQTWTKP
jgi:hypothetical protein